jgi:hypothetical protein
LKNAGQEYGIDVSQQAPAAADEAQQVRLIEDAINQGNDANSIVPAFTRAQRQKIVTITHESPQQKNADFDLVAVLACFLGGVDPFGGAGKLSGMMLAVVILQLVSTGVNLLRMDPFFIQVMWGLISVTLIVMKLVNTRLRERQRLQASRNMQKNQMLKERG